MLVLGFMGSPRLNGMNGKLVRKVLEGAESRGAETKIIELIKCDIKFCRGCFSCVFKDHELPIGICPMQDDMASILEEYSRADGYVFSSPNYDGYISALMKVFCERRISLLFRDEDAYVQMGMPRAPADFKKKAALIVTANCPEEFREVMGDPCFDAMSSHLILEQIEIIDKFYVGGVENMPDETLGENLDKAYAMGARIVEEIEKER